MVVDTTAPSEIVEGQLNTLRHFGLRCTDHFFFRYRVTNALLALETNSKLRVVGGIPPFKFSWYFLGKRIKRHSARDEFVTEVNLSAVLLSSVDRTVVTVSAIGALMAINFCCW